MIPPRSIGTRAARRLLLRGPRRPCEDRGRGVWSLRIGASAVILAVLSLGSGEGRVSAQADVVGVRVLELRGMINPVSERYLVREIEQASAEGVPMVLIELDTPGGLLESTHRLTSAMLASDVPIAVFVTPAGARAASAGVFVTLAAHVAVMAPTTRIGAATPVSSGGEDIPSDLREKVVNDAVVFGRSLAEARGRNADWVEQAVRDAAVIDAARAVEIGVVDLVAADRSALFQLIDGRQVRTRAGLVTIAVPSAPTEERSMSPFESLLMAIADPNIALLLLSLGGLAIYLELASPGLFFPGIAGCVFLLLGFLSLGVLPVSFAGVALVLLGLALLGAEIFIASGGILGVGGLAAFALGSVVLIDDGQAPLLQVSSPLIVSLTGALGVFMLISARLVLAARRRPLALGDGALSATAAIVQAGDQVVVGGERWRARTASGSGLAAGTRVRVVRRDGLALVVEPLADPDPRSPSEDDGGPEPSRQDRRRTS